MKSPFDRSTFKALRQAVAGHGGLGALMESTLVGWRAAQALKGGKRKAASAKRRAPARKRTPVRRAPARLVAPPRRQYGRLEALGWFLAAGVILAWPRERSPFEWSFLKRQVTPPKTHAQEVFAAHELEPGRGRNAEHPGQIPVRGWKDILWRAWTEFNRDNIPQVAGGVTFFGLLALFPAMAAFVSLYGLFFDPATAQQQVALLNGVLPVEALGFVSDQIKRLAAAQHAGLSFGFISGLLLSVWSANAGMKALMVGLNISFEEREKRKFIQLNLVSLAFTLGGLIFVILAAGAVIVVPVVLAFVGYKGSALALLRWPVMLLVAVGAITVLYRYGPSRQLERWKWVTAGSALAAVLWLTASLLFSIYVAHFGNYDKTYGSLGAVVGFMTWIWVSIITILFGAEINSEIEHQTAVDTTTGKPVPMGKRGAYMADTLGAARPKPDASGKVPEPPMTPGGAAA